MDKKDESNGKKKQKEDIERDIKRQKEWGGYPRYEKT